MDANELATVAIDAMPLGVLAEADRGQVWGVLQMALRTLEAQHAALLAEADEEAAEAKKLWREALAELDALKVDRDAVMAANHALNVDLRKANAEIELAAKALEFSERKVGKLVDELTVTTQERDALKNERALFLRDEGPPGALSVALQDRDNAVLEMKAAQRAADEFKSQRSIAESELSRCRSDRDMFKRLRDKCMDERDAYATKLEKVQAELQKRIDNLNAENARLHRSLEERMTVRIPGAVPVARTEELHGMADVFAQSQRMQGNA